MICLCSALSAQAQTLTRDLKLSAASEITITNTFGRIAIRTDADNRGSLTATSEKGVADGEVRVTADRGINITVDTAVSSKQIDLVITLPEGCDVSAETRSGQIEFSGSFAKARAVTDTGTIVADVPTFQITYNFRWTESRPRYVADIELNDVKEKNAGRFEIKGVYRDDGSSVTKKKSKDEGIKKQMPVSLDLTTARGIILLNVPPNEVSDDLRERPLTNAAKAIVRSGDSLLMEAIRRAAPKYYGDYLSSLPPIKREPRLNERAAETGTSEPSIKTATVRVTDLKNRSVSGLSASDFIVTESGSEREILSVTTSNAPFNLVLLLDVSGSVENYTTFIRKAARAFIDTVDKKDRIAIVIFNDDVKQLATFTTDKGKLSESLDTFDAGGGTAYFDALAYTISDTLRPLKGERSAVVILTDGEDNRSFLAFDPLKGSIQESGALIYPLYVPSGLIAEAALGRQEIDPTRKKYLSLSSRSQGEGEKLAQISGGIYYPITRIDEIQKAYQDIVEQLRTAYNVTFRSQLGGKGISPRLKVRVKKENMFTTITAIAPEPDKPSI